MSLLMQALQKAAMEREGAPQTRTDSSALPGDLALEPLDAAPPTRSGLTGASGRGSGNPTPSQAASVLRAAQAGPSIGDWLRDHRNAFYGGLLGAVVLGYAAYFYMSVYHPALLRRTPSPALVAGASTPAPPSTANLSAPPAPASAESAQAAGPPPEASPAASRAGSDPTSLQSSTGQTTPPRAVERSRGATGYRVPAQPSPPAAEPTGRRARDSIAVRPGGEPPHLNPRLAEAYDALRSGRTEEAKRLYDALLAKEPGNIDVLLGRAMIAQQQGDPNLATRYFYQVMQLDPSNTIAQGALVNLLGRADPQAAESRLKSLIAKEPSAFLYFSLGNLYADQGNWPSAQTAYFQAYHFQPDNADYAFNLAVGLEHLSQPKLALDFYRKALDLARAGRANFDSAAVQERVLRLAAGVD